MRVTSKGQVTIPQEIREKLGITPSSEVDFVAEGSKVYILKKKKTDAPSRKFRSLRGAATVKLSTDDIMKLTREGSSPKQT